MNITNIISTIARIAMKVRSFLAFAALFLVFLLVIFVWAFSRGSFDSIIAQLHVLSSTQFFVLVLLTILLLFSLCFSLILLAYKSAPASSDTSSIFTSTAPMVIPVSFIGSTIQMHYNTAIEVAERKIKGHPTGDRGIHAVFTLTNPHALAMSVTRLYVEVQSCEVVNLLDITILLGAVIPKRMFQCAIKTNSGSYECTFTGTNSEYIRLMPAESERFDIEIRSSCQGVYLLNIIADIEQGQNRSRVKLNLDPLKIGYFDAEQGMAIFQRKRKQMMGAEPSH